MSECWFCGRNQADEHATYRCPVYYVTGDAVMPRGRKAFQVGWMLLAKSLHVPIERCPSCARAQRWLDTVHAIRPLVSTLAIGGAVALAIARPWIVEDIGGLPLAVELLIVLWIAAAVPWGISRIVYLVRRDLGWPDLGENPTLQRWVEAFWIIGNVGDVGGDRWPTCEPENPLDWAGEVTSAGFVYPILWAWRKLSGRRGSAEYAPAWTPLAGLPAGEALHGKPRLWERPGVREGEEIVGPDGGAMVWVPAGEFEMGSAKVFHSTPVHRVRLTKGFWLGKAPVTERQYEAFCRAATARSMGPRDLDGEGPVIAVDWVDAQAYCLWHSMSLPTEAQWERAARGPVKMAGGGGQWCGDWSAKYEADEAVDPAGPEDGKGRAIRGRASDGKAGDDGRVVRGSGDPLQRAEDLGFRCVAGP